MTEQPTHEDVIRLEGALHLMRFALDRLIKAEHKPAPEYLRDLLDRVTDDPGEPCDRDAQYARAERAEAALRRMADETATETPAPDDRRLHACIEFGTWFDRSVCAEPCGAMHTRCTECGVALDTCPQQPAAGARQDETATQTPAPDQIRTVSNDCCGAEPPQDGTWGDCWCTLPPNHDGKHRCQPCTDRHSAPGWTDQPAAGARQDGAET